MDGTNVPTPSSSPADSASPAPAPRTATPPNAFEAGFLARLEDWDEPPAAEVAEWAGPWRVEETPDGGLGWLAVFDEDLVNGLSWSEALSFFLEACGKVVLERAGAILEERVAAMPG